jgi:accessory gene regulator B
MIEALSQKISGYVYRHNDRGHVSQEVMKFALVSLLSTTFTIVLSLIIGLIDGKFLLTVLSLAAIAVMRNLTGGYHFKSTAACIIVSAGVITLIPFIPVSPIAFYIMSIISLLLVIGYAPSNLRGVSRLTESNLKAMKWVAVLLILSNFLLTSDIISLAFFIQAVSLLPGKWGERDA